MTAAAKGSTANSMLLTQSQPTAALCTQLFHLVNTADESDATGLVPVVTISKAGSAFAAAAGVVTELTNGWYQVVWAAADVNTLGCMGVRITATNADSLNFTNQVTAFDVSTTYENAISTGTAQAGGGSTITLASGEPAIDGFYDGDLVRITGGTGKGQVRAIISGGYVGATKVATVDRAWKTAPDNTSTYELTAADPIVLDAVVLQDGSLTATKISADGLAAMSGHLTSKPTVLVGTLTSSVTTVARSMKTSYDTIITLAGTFNGATVQVQTTEDETAASPIWTDRSSGGLTAAGSVTVTGPHSAWRAHVTTGSVTSVTVKSSDRSTAE